MPVINCHQSPCIIIISLQVPIIFDSFMTPSNTAKVLKSVVSHTPDFPCVSFVLMGFFSSLIFISFDGNVCVCYLAFS